MKSKKNASTVQRRAKRLSGNRSYSGCHARKRRTGVRRLRVPSVQNGHRKGEILLHPVLTRRLKATPRGSRHRTVFTETYKQRLAIFLSLQTGSKQRKENCTDTSCPHGDSAFCSSKTKTSPQRKSEVERTSCRTSRAPSLRHFSAPAPVVTARSSPMIASIAPPAVDPPCTEIYHVFESLHPTASEPSLERRGIVAQSGSSADESEFAEGTIFQAYGEVDCSFETKASACSVVWKSPPSKHDVAQMSPHDNNVAKQRGATVEIGKEVMCQASDSQGSLFDLIKAAAESGDWRSEDTPGACPSRTESQLSAPVSVEQTYLVLSSSQGSVVSGQSIEDVYLWTSDALGSGSSSEGFTTVTSDVDEEEGLDSDWWSDDSDQVLLVGSSEDDFEVQGLGLPAELLFESRRREEPLYTDEISDSESASDSDNSIVWLPLRSSASLVFENTGSRRQGARQQQNSGTGDTLIEMLEECLGSSLDSNILLFRRLDDGILPMPSSANCHSLGSELAQSFENWDESEAGINCSTAACQSQAGTNCSTTVGQSEAGINCSTAVCQSEAGINCSTSVFQSGAGINSNTVHLQNRTDRNTPRRSESEMFDLIDTFLRMAETSVNDEELECCPAINVAVKYNENFSAETDTGVDIAVPRMHFARCVLVPTEGEFDHTPWTQNEINSAETGLYMFGWNFKAISTLIGTKSEPECRNFLLHNYKAIQRQVSSTRMSSRRRMYAPVDMAIIARNSKTQVCPYVSPERADNSSPLAWAIQGRQLVRREIVVRERRVCKEFSRTPARAQRASNLSVTTSETLVPSWRNKQSLQASSLTKGLRYGRSRQGVHITRLNFSLFIEKKDVTLEGCTEGRTWVVRTFRLPVPLYRRSLDTSCVRSQSSRSIEGAASRRYELCGRVSGDDKRETGDRCEPVKPARIQKGPKLKASSETNKRNDALPAGRQPPAQSRNGKRMREESQSDDTQGNVGGACGGRPKEQPLVSKNKRKLGITRAYDAALAKRKEKARERRIGASFHYFASGYDENRERVVPVTRRENKIWKPYTVLGIYSLF